jgi:hypothetical protein
MNEPMKPFRRVGARKDDIAGLALIATKIPVREVQYEAPEALLLTFC